MSFEAFSHEEVQKIVNHTLESMSKENLEEQVQRFGSLEKYKEYLASGFANEQAMTDLMKWYGSKEKAMEAIMQSTGNSEEIQQEQDENTRIYKQFMSAKEYLQNAKLAEVTDSQFGEGCSEYIANAIKRYYGV